MYSPDTTSQMSFSQKKILLLRSLHVLWLRQLLPKGGCEQPAWSRSESRNVRQAISSRAQFPASAELCFDDEPRMTKHLQSACREVTGERWRFSCSSGGAESPWLLTTPAFAPFFPKSPGRSSTGALGRDCHEVQTSRRVFRSSGNPNLSPPAT